MKITTYKCDLCGKVMDSHKADISFKAFPFHGQKVDFYAKAGSGEDVDICKYCIIDLVNSIDDRPMQETEL